MPGMTQLILLIALVVLAVVLAVLATVAWRLARWSARTRSLLALKARVADISMRADAAIGKAGEVIDAVRRGTASGDEIAGDLSEALTATELLAADARALRGAAGRDAIRSALVDELERAGRALQLVQHGCGLLITARARQHDPEAQTAIKRGYLNLVHARESIAGHATAAAAIEVTMPRFLRRRPAA